MKRKAHPCDVTDNTQILKAKLASLHDQTPLAKAKDHPEDIAAELGKIESEVQRTNSACELMREIYQKLVTYSKGNF